MNTQWSRVLEKKIRLLHNTLFSMSHNNTNKIEYMLIKTMSIVTPLF